MRLILALLLAAVAFPQVQLVYTPEPMGVATQLYGPLNEFGVWNVRVFNVSNNPVSIDSARIYIAGAQLNLISKEHALVVIHNRKRDRWQSKLLFGGSLLTGAATLAVGGYAANGNPSRTTTKVVSILGVSTPILMLIGNALRASIPEINETEILDGKIQLEGRSGAVRIVFARKRPNPQVLEVMVDTK